MPKGIKSVFICLFLIVIFSQCKSQSFGKNKIIIESSDLQTFKKMTFSQLVDSIKRKIVDLTAFSDMFLAKEFLYLFGNPEKFEKEVLIYIAESSNDNEKKMIALHSVQNLSENRYIVFAGKVADLYSRNKVDETLVYYAILAQYSPNYTIISNYRNKRVVALLNLIFNDSKTSSEFRENIKEMLSGKAWSSLKEFNEYNKY